MKTAKGFKFLVWDVRVYNAITASNKNLPSQSSRKLDGAIRLRSHLYVVSLIVSGVLTCIDGRHRELWSDGVDVEGDGRSLGLRHPRVGVVAGGTGCRSLATMLLGQGPSPKCTSCILQMRAKTTAARRTKNCTLHFQPPSTLHLVYVRFHYCVSPLIGDHRSVRVMSLVCSQLLLVSLMITLTHHHLSLMNTVFFWCGIS